MVSLGKDTEAMDGALTSAQAITKRGPHARKALSERQDTIWPCWQQRWLQRHVLRHTSSIAVIAADSLQLGIHKARPVGGADSL